jgi:hypothetical protein
VAWETPRVWTGDARDRQIRDNLLYLYDEVTSPTVPYCVLWNSADIPLPESTSLQVHFDTEVADTDSMFDATTTATWDVVTIQTAGLYSIKFNCRILADTTAGRRNINIKHEGTVIGAVEVAEASSAGRFMGLVAADVVCAVDDEITVEAYQTSGDPLRIVSASQYSPRLSVVKVG